MVVITAAIVASGFYSALADDSSNKSGPADASEEGRKIAASEYRPSPRNNARIAYHPGSDRFVLFGGAQTMGGDLNDIWAYDPGANRWTGVPPSTPSPPTSGADRAAVAYDSQSDRFVMFKSGETWAYDFSANTWMNMRPSRAPPVAPVRLGIRMAYDSESDRIILFGGRDNITPRIWQDTWAYDYDTNTWTEMGGADPRLARHHSGMVYDQVHDRIIVFGGAVFCKRPVDTWAYDYNSDTWVQLDSGTGPSGRGDITTTYDTRTGRMIVFGGIGPCPKEVMNDETWSFDFEARVWTRMRPNIAPRARFSFAMAYDESRGRSILFGGTLGFRQGLRLGDTWTYDSAADEWTLVDDEPANIEREAIRHLRASKSQGLARGDKRLVNSLDDAERSVWKSLGYPHPLRPMAISTAPGADVVIANPKRNSIDLVLGPSWADRLAARDALRILWDNGVVTTILLPDGWPSRPLRFHGRLWVDAWEQDLMIQSRRHQTPGLVILRVRVGDASLGFTLSLDTQAVAHLTFVYGLLPFWIDGAHLDAHYGKIVFARAEEAVEELITCEVGDGGRDGDDEEDDEEGCGGDEEDDDERDRLEGFCLLTPWKWSEAERKTLHAVCLAIADLLVRAVGGLARLAIAEAWEALGTSAAGPAVSEVRKSEASMEAALKAWHAFRYGCAVERFGDAWTHANRAIELALDEGDDDDEEDG